MKPKFFITTTVPLTWSFFTGQPRLWNSVFDVCAISSEGSEFASFVNDEGIREYVIPMKREISFWHDLWALVLFVSFFLKERPFIVHGNTPKASMLSMVAAWLTWRPVRIYMCHGLRYQTTTGVIRRILVAIEKLTCFCATNVICVSKGVMEQLVADNICKQKKAMVVGNGTAGGIDTEYFSRQRLDPNRCVRSELGIPKDAFVFSFVGRIVADKGINELVSAAEQLMAERENVYLLLVGREENDLDPISSESKDIIINNPKIYAVGWQEDVRPYLAASDAFVLPSYREGVGMVILEANAMDVPSIASDIIGCHDVVEPMVNGTLVQPRNTNSLYTVMKEWVAHPEMVKEMAKKCRNVVLEHYSNVDVRNAYFEEYKKLAGL